jgi:hypothetical protein
MSFNTWSYPRYFLGVQKRKVVKMTRIIEIDNELYDYLVREKKYRGWIGTDCSIQKNGKEVKIKEISFSNLIREKFCLPPMHRGYRYKKMKKIKFEYVIENIISIFQQLYNEYNGNGGLLLKYEIISRSHYNREWVNKGLEYLEKFKYIGVEKTGSFYDKKTKTKQPYDFLLTLNSHSGFRFPSDKNKKSKKDNNPPKPIAQYGTKFMRPNLPDEIDITDIYKYYWCEGEPLFSLHKILKDIKKNKNK